jgi:shikimate kinase
MSLRFFVIGLPGVGKTSVGKQLAVELQLPFIDLDSYIEETQDQTIAQIFSEGGEDAFRNIEAHALRSYTKLNTRFVMACGGGAPCFNKNMDFMNQHGITIYLTKPVESIVAQLEKDTVERPLLKNTKPANLINHLNKLLNKRELYYLKANVVSDTIESTIKGLAMLKSNADVAF